MFTGFCWCFSPCESLHWLYRLVLLYRNNTICSIRDFPIARGLNTNWFTRGGVPGVAGSWSLTNLQPDKHSAWLADCATLPGIFCCDRVSITEVHKKCGNSKFGVSFSGRNGLTIAIWVLSQGCSIGSLVSSLMDLRHGLRKVVEMVLESSGKGCCFLEVIYLSLWCFKHLLQFSYKFYWIQLK